ncbi:MAG: uroporphyrinogen-III C-methyltransferase [Pirellulaceae bacterium]|nr:uroporphyrinogen-III C-methyltransferase [Pirellulaceae bacterium]
MTQESQTAGKVFLVGAGPGDPGLITLRAVDCLRQADAVLYDYLVNPRILEHVSPTAECICLGQHGRTRLWQQDEINAKFIELARQGKTVVRLKGGDPAVFARGAEEVKALADEGIAFELVPGITAALAAASYTGVAVTHRELSSAVALVTGQEHEGKDESSLDYEALARFPGTLVIYMGVTSADHWTRCLLEAGKDPETPVVIVRRCSAPNQETIHCRLDEVAGKMADDGLRPPAVVIIGVVADLSGTLSWFEARPLFGQRVMVTRPVSQAQSLVKQLSELGAEVICQPAIEICPPQDWEAVDAILNDLSRFDWLVFSSSNGVRFLLNRLLEIGGDMRDLGGIRLAAIGPGTAETIQQYHLNVDLQPTEYRAEALAEALGPKVREQSVLLARASRGREVLAERLQEAGATVEQVVVYQSQDVLTVAEGVTERLAAGDVDWVMVTSSAIARSLVALLGEHLSTVRLASISPITSEVLRELGLTPTVEAEAYTMEGIVDAIVQAKMA